MSHTRQFRCKKHQNLTREQARAMWAQVVKIAVSSNSYNDDLRREVISFLDKGEYAELLDLSGLLIQTKYESSEEHFLAHQLSNLIRKYPDLPGLAVNPRDAAIQTFESAEWRCKWVNRRIALVRARDDQPHVYERGEAQKFIRYVLRDKRKYDPQGFTCDFPYDELWGRCDFSAGASIGVGGNSTHLYAKLMQSKIDGWTCSPLAFNYAARALWENSHMQEWILTREGERHFCVDGREFAKTLQKLVKLVGYNRVGYVPKTALTDRSIAVEPTLNTFLQKGVDVMLRERLRTIGIDLTDQSANQRMAHLGSLEWETEDPYCTIDLSSASDTISIMCVRDLLPEEWFRVLDDLRSHYREDGKGVKKYEKFTTMGNGFCFPLQTLIFSSLCVAAYAAKGLKPDYRVYGDDIIVRRSVFAKVMELLKFYGFVPNAKKTFSEGPFRESCGGDYHKGTNVRPIVFDCALDQIQKAFAFHNQTLRSTNPFVKTYFAEVRAFVKGYVSAEVRYVSEVDPIVYISSNETLDGAFWVDQDEALASPFTRWNRNTQSLSYVRLQAKPVTDDESISKSPLWGLGLLMAALRGGTSSTPFTLRYQTDYRPRLINPERDYAGGDFGRQFGMPKSRERNEQLRVPTT